MRKVTDNAEMNQIINNLDIVINTNEILKFVPFGDIISYIDEEAAVAVNNIIKLKWHGSVDKLNGVQRYGAGNGREVYLQRANDMRAVTIIDYNDNGTLKCITTHVTPEMVALNGELIDIDVSDLDNHYIDNATVKGFKLLNISTNETVIVYRSITDRITSFAKEYGYSLSDIVVTHGGACVLAGLRQSTNDIDVSVTRAIWVDQIRKNATPICLGDGVWKIECNYGIDLHISKDHVKYPNVVTDDGIVYRSIRQTLYDYEKLNRTKDSNIISILKTQCKIKPTDSNWTVIKSERVEGAKLSVVLEIVSALGIEIGHKELQVTELAILIVKDFAGNVILGIDTIDRHIQLNTNSALVGSVAIPYKQLQSMSELFEKLDRV